MRPRRGARPPPVRRASRREVGLGSKLPSRSPAAPRRCSSFGSRRPGPKRVAVQAGDGDRGGKAAVAKSVFGQTCHPLPRRIETVWEASSPPRGRVAGRRSRPHRHREEIAVAKPVRGAKARPRFRAAPRSSSSRCSRPRDRGARRRSSPRGRSRTGCRRRRRKAWERGDTRRHRAPRGRSGGMRRPYGRTECAARSHAVDPLEVRALVASPADRGADNCNPPGARTQDAPAAQSSGTPHRRPSTSRIRPRG